MFFELSNRRGHSGEGGVYITYKGFSNDASACGYSTKVDVARDSDDMEVSVLPMSNSAIKDGKIESHIFPTFSSLDSNGGFIDLTSFHLSPDYDTGIEDLKCVVKKFTAGESFDGNNTRPSKTLTDPRKYNLVVAKNGPDSFQTLLVLQSPLQRGQTVLLSYGIPSLSYNDKTPCFRSSIERAIWATKSEASEQLLSWLAHEANTGSENQAVSCLHIRRIYWVAIRLCKIKCVDVADEKLETIRRCYSACLQKDTSKATSCLSNEVADEFLFFLDKEARLGSTTRETWFELARELFNEIVSILGQSLFCSVSERLQACVDARLQGDAMLASKLTFRHAAHFDSTDVTEDCSLGLFESNSCDSMKEYIVGLRSCDSGAGTFVIRETPAPNDGHAHIGLEWYRSFLLNLVGETLSAFGAYLACNNEKRIDLVSVLAALKLKWGGRGIAQPFRSKHRASLCLGPSHVSPSPASLPFFLDLVWPVLQDRGWAIVCKEDSSQILFSPKQMKRERTGQQKLERDQLREKDQSDVDNSSLGLMDKTSQRLLIKVGDPELTDADGSGLTVKQIFDRFAETLVHPPSSEENAKRVYQIVSQIETLFVRYVNLVTRRQLQRDSSTLPGHYLLQFLPLVQDILRSSNQQSQKRRQALAVLGDLREFVSQKQETLVEEKLHVSLETYDDCEENVSLAIPWIKTALKAKGSTVRDAFGPLVGPNDTKRLSDFLVCLLNHVRTTCLRRTDQFKLTQLLHRLSHFTQRKTMSSGRSLESLLGHRGWFVNIVWVRSMKAGISSQVWRA